MVHSMTGFGRASFQVEGQSFDVEARSVNHRHLDVRIRLPRQLSDQEPVAKLLAQEHISRGKVEVSVNQVELQGASGELEVDVALAEQYVRAARGLSESHGLKQELDVTALLSMPGVTRFVEKNLPEAALEAGLLEGLSVALTELVSMRVAEGGKLVTEFDRRLKSVSGLVDAFEERSALVVEAARERLRRRTDQIRQDTGLIDEARLHQEIVIAGRSPGHHRGTRSAPKSRFPIPGHHVRDGRDQAGGASTRLPDPGDAAGGQYRGVEGQRCAPGPPGGGTQNRA